jgi:hypothetical protein
MVREQNGHVDVELVQLTPHGGGRFHDLRPVAASGPGSAELGARGHAGEVEVALGHLGYGSQGHVPWGSGVLGELGRLLVDVDVGVENEEVFELGADHSRGLVGRLGGADGRRRGGHVPPCSQVHCS